MCEECRKLYRSWLNSEFMGPAAQPVTGWKNFKAGANDSPRDPEARRTRQQARIDLVREQLAAIVRNCVDGNHVEVAA